MRHVMAQKSDEVRSVKMGGKECGYRINHNDLVKAGTLTFTRK